MLVRTITGSVIKPDGDPVTSGELVITPIGDLPADVNEAVVNLSLVYPIVDGEVTGDLVAPCIYRFEVIVERRRVISFIAGIEEDNPADPFTLQSILAANITDPDLVLQVPGPQGVKGDQGNPGVPGLVWQGDWDTDTAYVENDVVSNDGSAYVCTDAHTGQEPPNASYWALLVSKGDTGQTGSAGPQGVVWQGTWVDHIRYEIGDAVIHNGSSYICTSDHEDVEPPNVSYWNVLASKGDQGANGLQGANGVPGLPGTPASNLRTFSWVVSAPSVGGLPGPRIPAASTVIRIDAYVVAATSATFNIEERSTVGVAGADINGTDLEAVTAGVNSTSFTNSDLAAGNWLWLDISNANGNPGVLVVTMTYTEP